MLELLGRNMRHNTNPIPGWGLSMIDDWVFLFLLLFGFCVWCRLRSPGWDVRLLWWMRLRIARIENSINYASWWFSGESWKVLGLQPPVLMPLALTFL